MDEEILLIVGVACICCVLLAGAGFAAYKYTQDDDGSTSTSHTSSSMDTSNTPPSSDASDGPAGTVGGGGGGKCNATVLTNYWTAIEGQDNLIDGCDAGYKGVFKLGSGTKNQKLKDCKGKTLATVDKYTWDSCYCEGTCKIGSSTYNIVKEKPNACFMKISKGWGIGSNDNGLVPFVSVTADKQYPYGTKLYIKELDGLKLPSGDTHNGCVRVDDECGDGCVKNQIDFHVGSYNNYKTLSGTLSECVNPQKQSCQVQSYRM